MAKMMPSIEALQAENLATLAHIIATCDRGELFGYLATRYDDVVTEMRDGRYVLSVATLEEPLVLSSARGGDDQERGHD